MRLVQTLVAGGLALSGCIFDPQARLDNADLHLVVTHVDAAAFRLALSLLPEGGGAAMFLRDPEVEGRDAIELYFPTLPSGRYLLTARELDAHDNVLRCATYRQSVDAAESPQDKTFDMTADRVVCPDPPLTAAPTVDAEPSPPDPDAGADPVADLDAVSGAKPDAGTADAAVVDAAGELDARPPSRERDARDRDARDRDAEDESEH